jgi:hypothetical protein
MFAGIHGPQRSGKTYFCVRTCIDFIKHTDRDIYTNLPLNPDRLARYAVAGRLRNLDKYYEVFRRIHLFIDFESLHSAKDFAKKNRDFWRFCRFDRAYKIRFFKEYYSNSDNVDTRGQGDSFPSRENWPVEYYADGYIWPTKWIFDFWRLTKRQRTVFMFDEFYEYFSSLDFRDRGVDVRKQLLSFTRQHGHDNHHVYLISHKSDDLDKIIRDGFMYQYFIENAKYRNLFQNSWLKGLKSPIQFFYVRSFVSGDRDVQDSYPIWPEKVIFECYNSNSTGSTLREINSGSCRSDRYDDNHGHNFIHNFARYFKTKGWIAFLFLSGAFVALYTIYNGYKKLLYPDSGAQEIIEHKKSESIQNFTSQNSLDESLFVLGVFPNKVIWSDNFKLSKGDVYHGLTVEKINPRHETIVFSAPNGKLFSIPFTGCRLAERKKEPDSKRTENKKR